ncbi:hypothetical protein BHM03_00035139 [Ensete ventricosum]|nr:hypothetical protein BHM03_00035139 [Ensete ventricosum]
MILTTWIISNNTLIVKTRFASNRCVESSRISMYAKCSSLEDAYRSFEEAEDRTNAVSWTAMFTAFQQHGHGDDVIQLFEQMIHEGVEPYCITFVSILSACSHNGLVDQGFKYLLDFMHNFKEKKIIIEDTMSTFNQQNLELDDEVARRLFEIEPDNVGNFVLLSNMYASHGQLEEAKEVRRTMESTGLRKETGCS